MLRVRKGRLFWLIVLLVFLVLIQLFGDDYLLDLAIMAGLGAILAMGLNVFWGHCGQANFGAAGFWGIGAYSLCLLQLKLGLPFWLALLVALVISFVVGLALSVPLLRLRSHTLALGTLAFGLAVFQILETWVAVTGGGHGIDVPTVFIFGRRCEGEFYYILVVVSVVICYLIVRFLTSSRVGRAMRAIREDELAATASGIDAMKYRRIAFILSSVYMGLAGGLHASYYGFLAPDMFNIHASILIVVAVVVGGLGSDFGAILGGASLWLLPEALSGFREYHVLVYGLILFLVVRFIPRGVVPFLEDNVPKCAAWSLGKVKMITRSKG